MNYDVAYKIVLQDIMEEVNRQLGKWGVQRHAFEKWQAILDEELAEFRCKVIAAEEDGYQELIHVVAVGISWLIDISLDKGEHK